MNAQSALDHPILERMKRDDDHSPAGREPRDGRIQEILQTRQLLVHRDP